MGATDHCFANRSGKENETDQCSRRFFCFSGLGKSSGSHKDKQNGSAHSVIQPRHRRQRSSCEATRRFAMQKRDINRWSTWLVVVIVGCWWMLLTAGEERGQLVETSLCFKRRLDGHDDHHGPMTIITSVQDGETQLTQSPQRGHDDGDRDKEDKDRFSSSGPNICGQAPYLLTRNDAGGDTSNGNCDNVANATIVSCTCLEGLNATNTKEWSFVVTTKQTEGSPTAPPTSLRLNELETPLEVTSITTLRVPPNLQTIRLIGNGKTPLPIKLTLTGSDTEQLVTATKVTGQASQLTTVQVANLDMSKVMMANGFLPRTITNLTLRNCNLSAIYTGFLTGFQQLTMLDVSKNHLPNIFDGLLQGSCGSSSCSIRELNLNNNNFTKIPDVLMGLTNLKIVRLSGNPISVPPVLSNDMFKYIEKLDLFEFNSTASGDPNQEDQVDPDKEASCGTNGVMKRAHSLAFCVPASPSSTVPNASSSSGQKRESNLVLALIIVGSILAFIAFALIIKLLFCRSDDVPDFTLPSRYKDTQVDETGGVYGAGDATNTYERQGTNGYQLFEGQDDTYSYDDAVTGLDMSLLQDPFLVTARIPLDSIRFGVCMKKGGFGVVFSGIYNRRRVAIKKLRKDRSANLRNVENFIKEVCLIASLKHPRIVEFIGVAWDSLRNFCAITELMEKGDLKQVLVSFSKRSASSKANMRKLFLRKRAKVIGMENDANGEATLEDNSGEASESQGPQSMEFPEFSWQNHKRSIMSHVAEALTYLHSLQPKVIHRDLKSKNILLNNAMEAKLSDFGIARERKIDESHMMTAGVGTSFWIAPEVLLGKDYDERADIFSFGVVMCEMDTGEYPYRQMNQIAQAAQEAAGAKLVPPKPQLGSKYQCTTILQLVAHGQLRPEMSVNCPADIADLANDCLAMDPDLRPTAEEIVYRLSQSHLPDSLSTPSGGDGNDEDISIMEEVEEE